MNFKHLLTLSFLTLFSFAAFSQKIMLVANHSDAKFTLLNDYDDSDKQELGTGSVEIKLEKDSKNRVRISKPGYQSVIKEYNKDLKWEKEQKITLDTRQVDITSATE